MSGSAKVTVTVKRRGRTVDGPLPNRPVRMMPGGVAGIVYGGDVYPLHAGDTIDLDDTSIPKGRCPGFVSPGTKIPYAASKTPTSSSARRRVSTPILADDAWTIEHNKFGNYVVFDADRATATAVVAAVQQSGLDVVRWDESVRAAFNGRHYDWFIRLKLDAPREEAVRRVRAALTPVKASAPAEQAADAEELRLARLEAQVAELARKAVALQLATTAGYVEELKAQLQAVELRAKSAEARARKLTASERRVVTENARLTQELDTARALADAPATQIDLDEYSQLVDLYSKERDQAREDADERAAAAAEANERAMRLEVDLANALAQLENANEAREAAQASAARGSAARGKSLTARKVMSLMWPSLVLHSDTEDIILRCFPDPRPLLLALSRLDTGVLKIKNVEGHKHLREVVDHIATGDKDAADMGRIYYREVELDGERRRWVFVHRKKDDKEQKHELARLARLDPERDLDYM
ncbi:MAG: hypothetical protein R2737_17150 [Candidatus Nanopelagicales bacterium]